MSEEEIIEKEILEKRRTDLKKRIDDMENYLSMDRQTGRSYRIANQIIDEFFKRPAGYLVLIEDHYYGINIGHRKEYKGLIIDDCGRSHIAAHRNANEMLATLVCDRISRDFPGVDFEIKHIRGAIFVIRKSPTYREKLNQEISELKNNLENGEY